MQIFQQEFREVKEFVNVGEQVASGQVAITSGNLGTILLLP